MNSTGEHENMDLNPSISDEILNRLSNSLKSADRSFRCDQRHDKSSRLSSAATSGNSYEVFRNNTTAVEVIVKEVPKKFNNNTMNKKNKPVVVQPRDNEVQSLKEAIDNLKIELNKANFKLVTTRKGFNNLVTELRKQIDVVNQREMQQHSKNLELKLENEKLKAILDSKCKLVARLKKEVINIKHMLKYVVKGICDAPQMPDHFNYSDGDYDDFEKGLKKDFRMKFASNLYNGSGGGVTFDSTMSKDYASFDKTS